MGPITLGYQFPEVNEAICKQLECGIVFGHPHVLECEVAEMLTDVIPCAEQVRFLKTGGEAVAACIRLARAYTGKDHIIQIGYNGWLNSLSAEGPVLPRQAAGTNPSEFPCVCRHFIIHAHGIWSKSRKFTQELIVIGSIVITADYAEMDKGKHSIKKSGICR